MNQENQEKVNALRLANWDHHSGNPGFISSWSLAVHGEGLPEALVRKFEDLLAPVHKEMTKAILEFWREHPLELVLLNQHFALQLLEHAVSNQRADESHPFTTKTLDEQLQAIAKAAADAGLSDIETAKQPVYCSRCHHRQAGEIDGLCDFCRTSLAEAERVKIEIQVDAIMDWLRDNYHSATVADIKGQLRRLMNGGN